MRRTVRLGLLQGFYERFLIRNLNRYSPPTQAGLYRDGPLQYYFLHGQAGGLSRLLQFSICASTFTIPRAQNRAGKGSILLWRQFTFPISYYLSMHTLIEENRGKFKFQWIYTQGVEWKSYIIVISTIYVFLSHPISKYLLNFKFSPIFV